MNFPEMIKNTRNALGETQGEFAKRFNTHANTVSRWESGQYEASYACLSFVVSFARDLIWQTCLYCNGTGRRLTRMGREKKKNDG